jgi:hypothetical protein
VIPNTLANAIITLVTLVWAGNFLASVFSQGYQSDSTLNFVFMAIVGGALALRREAKAVDGDGLLGRLLGHAVLRPHQPVSSDQQPSPDQPERTP